MLQLKKTCWTQQQSERGKEEERKLKAIQRSKGSTPQRGDTLDTQFSYLLPELANIWKNPTKAFLDKSFQAFSDRLEMLCKLRRFWPCKIWLLTYVKCSLRITQVIVSVQCPCSLKKRIKLKPIIGKLPSFLRSWKLLGKDSSITSQLFELG